MTLQDVAFITVLLSDITLFPAVNTVYNTFFGTSPPARACVALDLPTPTRIRMEVIACQDRELDVTSKRQGLHVQGLSYWAPANIGPYSQAIKVRPRL
jgi:diphthine-ammonia ligase